MNKLPPQLVARLSSDWNWWLDTPPGESVEIHAPHGLLDPRQVAHLAEVLLRYRRLGFEPRQASAAFHVLALGAELSEGSLRLIPSGMSLFGDGDVFALPRLDADGDGPYMDFLDDLSAVHVRYVNDNQPSIVPCTVDDMRQELDLLDQDRFFSAENLHAFDQINEILEWRPAGWSEAESD